MKTLFATLLLALVFSANALNVNLSDALKSNLVAIEASGVNYDSMQREMSFANVERKPSMQMTVKNLGSQPLSLSLDEGYMLEPVSAAYQPMLITQQIAMELPAHRAAKKYVYAMCTASSRSGPSSQTAYKLGGQAPPALLKLAHFIAQNNYQNGAAQDAVWCLSNDHPVSGIYSSSDAIKNSLQTAVAKIKGVDLKKLLLEEKAMNDAGFNPYFGTNRTDRNIVFSIDTSAVVTAGIYDLSGTLIKEYFTNRVFLKGTHSLRYEPYPVALAGKRYAVKMMINGEVYKEYFLRQ